MSIKVKRVYEAAAEDDGTRVLVDRLWPRGLTRGKARVDHWLRAIAPSTELRQWYHAGSGEWPEFKRRYVAELRARPAAVRALRDLAKAGDVTLLYSSRDTRCNHAIALRELLRRREK